MGDLAELGWAGAVGSLFQAGASAGNSAIWASAAQGMTTSNTEAWKYMNDRNALMQENVAQTAANASVDTTRWQVIGMIFAANTQYLQAIQQMKYMDQADRRSHFTARQQLLNESRGLTLAHNAAIRAMETEERLALNQMNVDHEYRMKQLDQPQVEEYTINLEDVPV